MKFKEEKQQEQFKLLPELLKRMASDFEMLSESLGIEPVVTRISDPVEDESGVHPDYRAIDFRDEHDGELLYSVTKRNTLVERMNEKWPREDGKLTLIWHSFRGAPNHFHLQCANDMRAYSSLLKRGKANVT